MGPLLEEVKVIFSQKVKTISGQRAMNRHGFLLEFFDPDQVSAYNGFLSE